MLTLSILRTFLNQVLCVLLYLLLFIRLYSCALRYGCPARPLIKPCSCQEITKGLDVSCEGIIDYMTH